MEHFGEFIFKLDEWFRWRCRLKTCIFNFGRQFVQTSNLCSVGIGHDGEHSFRYPV